MKRYGHLLVLLFSCLMSCEKQPPINPLMVMQLITGEVNGVPFKTGMAFQYGGAVRRDFCEKDVVALNLTRKIGEAEYQMVLLNFFHAKPGNYVLTDSPVSHRKKPPCTLDSVTASSYFKVFPGDDFTMDEYRLVEGPWNYFKVLYYNPEKNEIQGQFEAKFVRINKHQHGKEAVDTITYTNSKFIVSNLYDQEIFEEPR